MDIRIIFFLIVFLFALRVNKEGFTVKPMEGTISEIESKLPTNLLYGNENIYEYDNESNYDVDKLYEMKYTFNDYFDDINLKLDDSQRIIDEYICSPSPGCSPQRVFRD